MANLPLVPEDASVVVKATNKSFSPPVQPTPPPPLPCFSPESGTTKYGYPLPSAVVLSCSDLSVTAPAGLDLLSGGSDTPLPELFGVNDLMTQSSVASTRVSVFARYSDALQGPMWTPGVQAFDYAGGFAENAWVTCSDVWLRNGGIVAEEADLWISEGETLSLGPCTQKSAQDRARQVPGVTLAADWSVDIGGEVGVRLDIGVANALSIVDSGGLAEVQFPHGVLARHTVDATQGTPRLPRVGPAPTWLGAPGMMAFSDSNIYLQDSANNIHSFALS